MSRRELREQIFRILFRVEFHDPKEYEEQRELFFALEEGEASEKDISYVNDKAEDIIKRMEDKPHGKSGSYDHPPCGV